ncbi:hypothetical protein ACQP10_08530 [Streptosporangium sandarakinum]|uniref:hypothetical protein n=1 Tax=Streptosporangium sandarakinum TaxID=1260955 RepID=UPI003D9410B8
MNDVAAHQRFSELTSHTQDGLLRLQSIISDLGEHDLMALGGQLATVVTRLDSMERRAPVTIENMQVREEADIGRISAQLAFRQGARG